MSATPAPQLTTTLRQAELVSDIGKIRNEIDDSLAMGDSMFGTYAHAAVADQVSGRLEELKKKKEEMEEEIRQKEATIDRSNRDFTDVKDALPETEEQKRVSFIEDYTLMFVSLSYVFMVVSAIVYVVALSDTPSATLLKSLGIALVGTIVAGYVLYMIA